MVRATLAQPGTTLLALHRIDPVEAMARTHWPLIALAALLGWLLILVSGRTARHMVQHRQAELRMADAHAGFLQRMIDRIPNPIFYKDHHTRFLGCNRAYQTAFGYSPDELRGEVVKAYVILAPGYEPSAPPGRWTPADFRAGTMRQRLKRTLQRWAVQRPPL